MKSFNIVFYTIQHRRTHESPYGEPDGQLVPSSGEWAESSFDYFHEAFRPVRSKQANEDVLRLFAEIGANGWTSLQFAVQALRRARTLDQTGRFDSVDWTTYRKQQAVRHEFRIIRVTRSQTVEEVPIDQCRNT
jgi:hypothetical protein